MASTFKHNKRRNSGIVYELLVRRASDMLIEGDREGFERARGFLVKYYSDGTPLARERELFEVFRTTRGVPPDVARRVIAEVVVHARRLDRRRIDARKSDLLKEINCSLGRDFFNRYRLPEYRLLASIQIMIESGRGGRLLEGLQRIQLEEALVKYMSMGEVPPVRPQSEEDVDDLVCAVAFQRFQERYGAELSRGQQKLLDEYARLSLDDDRTEMLAHLSDERTRMLLKLKESRRSSEFRDDRVMSDRLEQAIRKLSLLTESDHEKVVMELMLFKKLEEEIASNE